MITKVRAAFTFIMGRQFENITQTQRDSQPCEDGNEQKSKQKDYDIEALVMCGIWKRQQCRDEERRVLTSIIV